MSFRYTARLASSALNPAKLRNMSFTAEAEIKTRHLPRILCLHGGGTNARIFQMQCRAISHKLLPHFRLVYAEAPFESTAGPDVLTVYAECGPFKRWLRWKEEQAPIEDSEAIRLVDNSLEVAMKEDDLRGATGPWVGLLGFSQGAKMVASLLYRQQVRAAKLGPGKAGSTWQFAVVMAGRGPIVALDPEVTTSSMLCRPSQIGLDSPPDLMEAARGEHILRLPTIHVHGLADPGLEYHRELLHQYCDPETSQLLEWGGDHRLPLKATDVGPLVDDILAVAAETGVLPTAGKGLSAAI